MTRPVIWALGAFGALAVAASVAGDRLAKLAPAIPPGHGPSAGPATAPAPPSSFVFSNAGHNLTIESDPRGHFHIETAIDGRRVTMMVDTGASIVALSHEDAVAAGIRPFPSDYTGRISTANGEIAVARVRIREIRVGEIYARDVDAVVVPAGRLGTSLLGMSFLRQLRSFDIAGNRLTLRG